MKRKITLQVDYEKTDLTSYQIYDWIEKTFGDKEVKPLTEEIRTSNGTLTHIEFVITEDAPAEPDLLKILTQTRALISEAAMEGFIPTPDEDGWASRLFRNNADLTKAIKALGG